MVLAMLALRGFPETAAAKRPDRTLVAGLRRVTRTRLIFLNPMSVVPIAGTAAKLALSRRFRTGP